MRHRMSELSLFDLVYDLSAVLIHKGIGANSGHYIAHIKDVNTGQWWEFDDEHVTNLGCHPFGEGFQILPLNPSRLMQFILIVLKR